MNLSSVKLYLIISALKLNDEIYGLDIDLYKHNNNSHGIYFLKVNEEYYKYDELFKKYSSDIKSEFENKYSDCILYINYNFDNIDCGDKSDFKLIYSNNLME